MSYQRLFSHFLAADPDRLHFAAHSHHLWPDVTRDAHLQCWEDAARHVDHKWGHIFGEILPAVRDGIAQTLGLSDGNTICFAPNTHELVMRMVSCFPHDRTLRVLTTDSEYHSFRRQARRLQEAGRFELTEIPAEPFSTFPDRFAAAAAAGGHDLVYFSHVLYNSGYVVPDLARLVNAVPDPATFVAIDAYHGFFALPTDLSTVEGRAFYLAGGYKYAMSGEGVCFVHCPPGYGERPVDTGWYAGFGAIAAPQADGPVPYNADGSRFFGATFDPAGLYQCRAVMEMLRDQGLTVDAIHRHVQARQARFLDRLDDAGHPQLRVEALLPDRSFAERGHFLTLRTDAASSLHDALGACGVVTDYRGDRLRFGFAIYHDDDTVDALIGRVAEMA